MTEEKEEYWNRGERQKQKAEAEAKKQKIKLLNEQEDLRYLIGTPQGYRWFRSFFAKGHMFHTTFTGNSYGMFNEGVRAASLRVFNELSIVDPQIAAKIITDIPEEDQ